MHVLYQNPSTMRTKLSLYSGQPRQKVQIVCKQAPPQYTTTVQSTLRIYNKCNKQNYMESPTEYTDNYKTIKIMQNYKTL